nr:hypothetical protein [Mycoplasmopsis bovis]QQH18702.1 hypothetical protein HYE49_02375 [Mycoplasmopsis bovis]
MKKSKFLILGSIASSSLLMIAAKWCERKRKWETSNSEKQDKPKQISKLSQVETKVKKPTQHHLEKGSNQDKKEN